MSKNWAVVFVSSTLALATSLAGVTGCSGSSGNGDLNGDGGSVLGGGLGGLGGSSSGGTSSGTDAGAKGGGLGTGSSSGTGTGSSSGATSDVCKLQTTNPACGQCIETSCCAQMKACAADTGCVAIDGCLSACGPQDEDCVRACVDKHPNGVTPWKAMYDCAQTQCTAACQ